MIHSWQSAIADHCFLRVLLAEISLCRIACNYKLTNRSDNKIHRPVHSQWEYQVRLSICDNRTCSTPAIYSDLMLAESLNIMSLIVCYEMEQGIDIPFTYSSLSWHNSALFV